MSMDMIYGLKRGFMTPNPKADVDAFVGPRNEWAVKLVNHLNGIILSGRVPKMVIWGPFGVGKTHLLHFLTAKLQDTARVVYIETPPCHRRTKFSEFHGVIMRKLGREATLRLLEEAVKNPVGNIAFELGISQDMTALLTQGLSVDKSTLWRYLSGEKLSARELRTVDAVSSQIREDEAIEVLGLIARLVKRREKRNLLLFIDEFENTIALLGDSLNMFREAVRGMVSPENDIGVLFVDSARDVSIMSSILTEDTVRRRIGYGNFIDFKEYSKEELSEVIYGLLKHWRKPDFNVEKAVHAVSQSTEESVIGQSYPFTEDAIKKIIEVPFALREAAKIDSIRPKEALEVADQALAIAIQRSAPVIDSSLVNEACKIFESVLGGAGGVT